MAGKKSFCLQVVLCIAAVFSLAACKKVEPEKFSANDFLYFINKNYSEVILTVNMNAIYAKQQEYNFLITWNQTDSFRTNIDPTYQLYVQADGRLADRKRAVSLEIEGNGKEFAVFPDPDSIYIPANSIGYKLDMKLARPPLSDTGVKTLTITLKNNEDFKPEEHAWHKVTYVFGNMVKPTRFYSSIVDKYGEFSPAKMYAVREAVARKDKSFWETDPDVILLNTSLQNLGAKKFRFDPFTMDELYNIMDVTSYLQIPEQKGPVQNAYWALTQKMISLTKELIEERRAANNPILDASGKEISFP
ncbi:hypothetical protein EV199_2621 [Pseudobacter ginsenosidimutans]|uniref:DUF4843 domain-containing protein n=2 Tax=Pseudobacter ginsenosidimutans TaxID=661488 RepID=A0A4Q7MQS6_9BACT|nr:hypothetical protein EV199_2621 [Pseudobacter ginsenosidimutans]